MAVLVSGAEADLSAPAAPAGLEAEAGPGTVELAWEPVEDAVRYRVLRSLVSDGGYGAVGEAIDAAFSDQSVRDGVPYHYVVVALDEQGNVSARSEEVISRPPGERGESASMRAN